MTRHLVLLIAALLCASACDKNIAPPENALKDPGELRAIMEARLEELSSARLKEVVLDYFGKDERIKVRQLILVQRPASLRVQTRLPGSDEIVSLLVSDGQTFAMHRRDTNEYFTGRPTRESINLLLPVDLSGEDVVRVMLGGAPWDRIDQERGELKLSWDRSRGQYKLETATRAGGALEVWVRHGDWLMVAMKERGADGALSYEYEASRTKRINEATLPSRHRFVWPAKHLDFSLDVGETQLDVELPEQLFTLSPPPGSQIIEVD
jgi:outer membrane lipoprotein-sorting protein